MEGIRRYFRRATSAVLAPFSAALGKPPPLGQCKVEQAAQLPLVGERGLRANAQHVRRRIRRAVAGQSQLQKGYTYVSVNLTGQMIQNTCAAEATTMRMPVSKV